MEWLQQNLDAYRVVSEILTDLRMTLRAELERHQGKLWYRTGLPQDVLDRLIERKEKEKAIDWYENEYQQLIDFASFGDALEILEHNPKLLPAIHKLAPNAALLHARFMELEVMREKLAMTRPISEAELGFLITFHRRFRKALDDLKTTPDDEKQEAGGTIEPPAAAAQEAGPDAEAETPDQPSADDERTEKVEEDAPAKPPENPPKSRPPSRSASVPGGGSKPSKQAAAREAKEDEPAPETASAATADGKKSVAHLLEEGESKAVLRALYREVTAVAEGLWTTDLPPTTAVWERVRTHPWYEQNISKLGLKPLSDFYEIIAKVIDRMDDGIARDQLQDFLKEANFAKVLLALRDMFQRNGI